MYAYITCTWSFHVGVIIPKQFLRPRGNQYIGNKTKSITVRSRRGHKIFITTCRKVEERTTQPSASRQIDFGCWSHVFAKGQKTNRLRNVGVGIRPGEGYQWAIRDFQNCLFLHGWFQNSKDRLFSLWLQWWQKQHLYTFASGAIKWLWKSANGNNNHFVWCSDCLSVMAILSW